MPMVINGWGAYPDAPALPIHPVIRRERRIRLLLFIATWTVVTLFGCLWVWSRPPVYQSHALLQLKYLHAPRTPVEISQRFDQAVSHQQLLQSRHLMLALQQRLAGRGYVVPLADLEASLQATVLADNQLIRLAAEAPAGEQAALLLQEWELLYRQRFLEQRDQQLELKAQALDRQITTAQQHREQLQRELATYQQQHQIDSVERDENRTLNRIQGLSASLDRVTEQRLNAEAAVAELEAALARGEQVIRQQDQAELDRLRQREAELSTQLKHLQQRFTAKYLQINGSGPAIEQQLLQVRADINARIQQSRTSNLQALRRERDALRAQERTLKQELQGQGEQVRQIEGRLLELQQRTTQLAQLQQHLNDLSQQRGVLEESMIPLLQVGLLEPPYVPIEPRGPDYWRDTWRAAISGLVLAALALLLYHWFTPRIHPGLSFPSARKPAFKARWIEEDGGRPSLPEPTRILSPLEVQECQAMLGHAEPLGRLVIMLLLSGVHLREIPQLCWYHLEPGNRNLAVPSLPPRILTVPPRLQQALLQHKDGRQERLDSLVPDRQGNALGPEQLEQLIAWAALDAGLEGTPVTAARLEASYLHFLAEQGVQLEELERRGGSLMSLMRQELEQMIGNRPSADWYESTLVYPALRAV